MNNLFTSLVMTLISGEKIIKAFFVHLIKHVVHLRQIFRLNNLKLLMTGYFKSAKNRNIVFQSLPDPKTILSAALIFIASTVFAQETDASAEVASSNLESIVLGVLAITIIIVLFVVYLVSDKLLTISAAKVHGDHVSDSDSSARGISVLPSKEELVGTGTKSPFGDGKVVKLKRGFDITIAGRAKKETKGWLNSTTYAVKPVNFTGMSPIPKLLLEEGQEVKAGDKLFFDKKRPEIFYTAPVSGEVTEVRRGPKRMITDVVILADKEIKFAEFPKENPRNLTREQVIERMLNSGTWPSLRQRPFDIVADPEETPKAIFISGFNSAPLSANFDYTLAGQAKEFQAGIDALSRLTDGKIHLSLNAEQAPCDTYGAARGVEKHWFKGPHPAGAVGVQIHHIDPIRKGEVAWHINPDDVIVLGRLFLEGRYNTEKLICVGGPEVESPSYFKTYKGACISGLVDNNLKKDHVRYISGSVLTGSEIAKDGYLGFYDSYVSVIEEGDFMEFMGWLLPSYARPSLSPTFPWGFFPGMEFDVNTNTHGESRAFVVSGQYEEVTPMDIYPQHLLKAIMARDFEKMEGLGIYEVGEEDLALCEFVCTSKTPVQQILRDGLDYVREQS